MVQYTWTYIVMFTEEFKMLWNVHPLTTPTPARYSVYDVNADNIT